MATSLTIGVIAEAFDSGFHTPFFGSLHRELQQRNGRLVFVQGQPQAVVETGLATANVDGWIVMNAPEGALELAQLGRPVVTSSCQVGDLPAILTDNYVGIHEVMDHLIGMGRTRIAFVGWMMNRDFQERAAAYREALAAHGLPDDPALVIDPGGYDIIECYHAFARFLTQGGTIDAVVGANDKAAIGAIQALRTIGKRIPEDVAAVGFNDADLAQAHDPPLSSVRDRPDEIARIALLALIELINGRPIPAVTRVAARAIFRQSSQAERERPQATPDPQHYRSPDWQTVLARDLVTLALAPIPLDPHTPPEQHWPSVGQLSGALAEIERGSQPAPLHAEVLQEGILIAGGVANLTTVFEQLRQAGLQRLVPGDLARFDHFSAWLLTIHNQLAGIAALQVGNQLERQRESTVAETLLLTHLTRSDANPLFLDWMDVSWADWAALALWDNRTDQRRVLHVASTFERGVGARMLNTPCLASEFPATQLAPARFSQAPEYILKLSPLHSPAREWGYLATYERYRPTGYNTITSRNTFLATMLERSDLISSLTERQEVLQQAYDRERMLASTIRELGCPLIPLLPGVLMVPLVGAIDEQRAQQIIERVLAGVSQEQANRVLLDITGVPLVDTYVAAALMRMAQAVRLLGARVILVGVRPEIAQSIIGLNVDLGTIETRPTLGAALQLLLRRQTSSVGNAT